MERNLGEERQIVSTEENDFSFDINDLCSEAFLI
jgi:hypothetical protein